MTKSNKITKLLLAVCLFANSSCFVEERDIELSSSNAIIDNSAGLTREEFKDFFIKEKGLSHLEKETKRANNNPPPIPQITLPLAPIKEPTDSFGSKLISFSITEQIDLKDVLLELSRVANLDVDIDPAISGGVIINARNRPLKEVIDRICDMGSLRYEYNNGVLKFMPDTPYFKTYKVDFLIDSDLWGDLDSNLAAILKESSEDSSLSLNKPAGIASISANARGHRAASEYIWQVVRNTSAQVLIEAKVVEVTLNDNYRAGINWDFASGGGASSGATAGLNFTQAAGNDAADGLFTAALNNLNFFDGDVSATIELLEEFGTARTISSPRIHTINNKEATLNFTDKLVYFTIETETVDNVNNGGDVNNVSFKVTATKEEEEVGVELSITPSINLDTSEITMLLKPILSVDSGNDAIDPTTDDSGVPLGNTIPVIQTREIESIMKIKSGEVLVLGGLMKEVSTNNDSGLPFFAKIPFVGNLFKTTTRQTQTIETIIFVKATIINRNTSVDGHDREFHERFDRSPRPFFN